MSDLTDSIRSKGHWFIRIRPATFEPKRIPEYSALESIISRTAVRLRGWDFPHVGRYEELHRGFDWIGHETDWEYYREAWSLYQSGQFAYLLGIHEDWADRSQGWGPPKRLQEHGGLLGVGDTLFRFTEVFEFAARLAVTEAGDDSMYVGVDVKGLQNRSLWVDDPNRGSMEHWYTAHFDVYPYQEVVRRSVLVAEARELALKATLELFQRFGWTPSIELMRSQQAEPSRFAGYGYGGRS
jgi:hypothetical protein